MLGDQLLWRVLYTSRATEAFTQEQLDDLAMRAAMNNRRVGITGLLLYRAGMFMQVLEGPRDAVVSVFASIRHDRRHGWITAYINDPIGERLYPDWSMKLRVDPTSRAVRLAEDLGSIERFLSLSSDLPQDGLAASLMRYFEESDRSAKSRLVAMAGPAG